MLGAMPTDNEVTAASRAYGRILWEPGPGDIERARITDYRRWLAAERGLRAASYDVLWQWSVTELADFWQSVWDYFGVLGERGDGPVLADAAMPGAQWFPGATLNYARNALRAASTDPDRVAIIARAEDSSPRTLTYGELA